MHKSCGAFVAPIVMSLLAVYIRRASVLLMRAIERYIRVLRRTH
jgi:hypothetical protein